MFKLVLKRTVVDKIDAFLDSYLDSFLNLFIDSWIDNVHLIEENYKKVATNFRDKIYSSLNKTFEKDIIFWKKIWEEWDTSVIISIWNYKLFIEYREKAKIRFVEIIEFYKK